MKEVPKSLFSLPLALSPDNVSALIPRRFSEEYDIFSAKLGGADGFLVAIAAGFPKLSSSKALVRVLSQIDARPVAVCSPFFDNNAMKAFAQEGIPYIKDERNAFLPFLGMVVSPVPEGRAPAPLSPRAQRVAINLIEGRWDGLAAGELARELGVSGATVTKCLAEIKAILPSAISVEWKNRVLKNPGMTKSKLLEAFEPYFVSPVKATRLLKGRMALDALKQSGALLSGETALPHYTDLAHDSGAISVAVHYRKVAEIQKKVGDAWVEVKWFEQPDIIVEEWAYELDRFDNVSTASVGIASLDALDLYAEMFGKGEDDIRLADAVAQLREVICRE